MCQNSRNFFRLKWQVPVLKEDIRTTKMMGTKKLFLTMCLDAKTNKTKFQHDTRNRVRPYFVTSY